MTIEKQKHNSEKRLGKMGGLSLPNFSISGCVNVVVCSTSACVWGEPDEADAGRVANDMIHQRDNES